MNKNFSNKSEERALELFADMIISKIKDIQCDWKKPWFTEGAMFAPVNLSGRRYNGMNSLMLMLLCEEKGYKYPIFCTFDRVTSLTYKKDKNGKFVTLKDENGEKLPKVSIKKDEKSFPVFVTTFTCVHSKTKNRIKYEDFKSLTDEEKEMFNVYPSLRVYNVFNIDQTNLSGTRHDMYEQLTAKYKEPVRDAENFIFEPIDYMIEENAWECPIKPTYGDNAYYSISKDEIVVPEKRQFNNDEAFYSNILHEMAHSTGAENRLNRLKSSSFGSKEYAREELVAELTAALISSQNGITKNIKEDSMAYMKSWLDSLGEDSSFIKNVLLDVKKASSYISKKIDIVKEMNKELEVA